MKCFEISDEAMACECWTGEELMMMMDKLKMCTLKDEAKMVSEALVMCKDEFGKCRKFEDDSAAYHARVASVRYPVDWIIFSLTNCNCSSQRDSQYLFGKSKTP